jgi:hypothetical protein
VSGSGRISTRVRALVKVAPHPPHGNRALVVAAEDVVRINGDAVDGRVVRLHFADERASLGRPELDEARAATGNKRRRAGKEREAADPVL